MKTLDQLQRYTPVSEWDGEHATKKDPNGEYVKLSDVEAYLSTFSRHIEVDKYARGQTRVCYCTPWRTE